MAQPVPRKTVPWKGNAEYTVSEWQCRRFSCLDSRVRSPVLFADDDFLGRKQLVDVNERAEENAQRHGSQDLIFLTDAVEGEEGDDEDENDEEEEAVENDRDNEPTSCVGHFDRLDVEYAPKPTKQARAYVFYDENPVASWSGTPLLQQNEFSQRWDAMVADRKRASELGLLEDSSETEGRRSPRHSHPPTSPPHSPMQVLKRLQTSRTAVHRPEYEDLFFAGRLASTSVIMVHDGQPAEAERLGRWSVDLVGKKAWDKMVEMYSPGSRLETDDKNWMSSMLDDVHTWLRPIDDERAAELRTMISRWQDMDILPKIQGGQ